MQPILYPLAIILFILFLIFFPAESLHAAKNGVNLWFNTLFPSLLPFLVSAELLKGTAVIRWLGSRLEPIMRPLFNLPGESAFALVMGIFSGYPVGAKITADLKESCVLSKAEAERLISFCNNSSPVFITAAVCAGLFNKPEFGWIMLFSHITGSLCVGLLYNLLSRAEKEKIISYQKKEPVPCTLGGAIASSVNIILLIGGFVIIFNIIIAILLKLNIIHFFANIIHPIFNILGFETLFAGPLLAGLFEITTGINSLVLCSTNLEQQLIIASFIIGWGGFSVHAQTASIAAKASINIRPYLIGKVLHGIFSAVITAFLLSIL